MQNDMIATTDVKNVRTLGENPRNRPLRVGLAENSATQQQELMRRVGRSTSCHRQMSRQLLRDQSFWAFHLEILGSGANAPQSDPN